MTSTTTHAIHTKLLPPQTLRGITLLSRLEAQPDWLNGHYLLTTVVAPAGYGKSTVMSQWWTQLHAANKNAAWLSLDESDNDPARLITYLIYSLRTLYPKIGATVLSQLTGGSPPIFQPLMESLLIELSQVAPTALFLDDYHFITHPDCIQLVNWLLLNAPESLSFVMGSRSQPSVPLTRLQLRYNTLALSEKDLSFTEQESHDFLAQASNITLDSTAQHTLWKRTEGWPAALRLVALSMQEVSDPHQFIHTFSGNDRYITDYLGDVVLSLLPESMREFMLHTSVLDRMCADLCIAVTQQKTSQAMLEDIERRHLFLLPLDQERRWYRYHHLFADFLRAKLDCDQPGYAHELKRSAAQWCFSHGFLDEAIHYALAAASYSQAAQWISDCAADRVQWRGEHSTLLRWITQLPEDILSSWPTIRINYAWSLGFNRRFDEAEHELKKLEAYRDELRELPPSATTADQIKQINREVQLQRCVNSGLQDRPEDSRLTSDTWLQTWEDASWHQKGIAGVVLGFACKCTSEFELGAHHLLAAREALIKCDGYYGKAWADMVYTVLLAKQGRHQEALHICRQGLSYAIQYLGPHSHATNMLSTLMSAMHYERNELQNARDHLQHGLSSIQQQGSVDPLIAGYLTAARLSIIDHDADRAVELLDEGIDLGRTRDLPRLVVTLLYEKICLSLRNNNIETAVQLAQSEGLLGSYSITNFNNAIRNFSKRIQVRIAIAQNNPQLALETLNPLVERSIDLGHKRKQVEMLILKAHALDINQKTDAALQTLDHAIQLAATEGYSRAFIDEAAPLKSLMIKKLETQEVRSTPPSTAAATLIKAIADELDISPGECMPLNHNALPFEPLTTKETQLLELLRSGKPNKQIASEMYISVGTVKWHLHNIYAKLAVRNRTQALAKAQSLGLLH